MNIAQFNDLCNREHSRDGGIVAALHLTLESYNELIAEVLGDPDTRFEGQPGTACGATLDAMTNPATRTVVKVNLASRLSATRAEVEAADGQIRAVELAA